EEPFSRDLTCYAHTTHPRPVGGDGDDRAQVEASGFAGGGGGRRMGLGGRGIVGERWSQRILWICALGSAVSLYFVAVERQAQNRARAVAEGLKALDGAGGGAGEDV
ncbi:unnamed protein product, partial [Urochloa humidicola]